MITQLLKEKYGVCVECNDVAAATCTACGARYCRSCYQDHAKMRTLTGGR